MLRTKMSYPALNSSCIMRRMPFASHIPYHVAGRGYVGPLVITLKTFECLSPSEIMQGAK
jgi:hypothetical protein